MALTKKSLWTDDGKDEIYDDTFFWIFFYCYYITMHGSAPVGWVGGTDG